MPLFIIYHNIMVKTKRIELRTRGNCDIVDITAQVHDGVLESGINSGTVTVFNIGSTAGVTTIEYEPGLVNYDSTPPLKR